jgi:hypothetical protein
VILCAVRLLDAQTREPSASVDIHGTVLRAATGSPLGGARVILRPVAPVEASSPTVSLNPSRFLPGRVAVDSVSATAMTDSNGRFTFLGVPLGSYRVVAERNGFLPSEYGQRSPNGTGIPVLLVGSKTVVLEIRLTEAGIIAGQVGDEFGEPMPDRRVTAYHYEYTDGRSMLTPSATTQTNDKGEYRLTQLEPGEYLISILAQSDREGSTVNLSQVQAKANSPAARPATSGTGVATIVGPGTSVADALGGLPFFYPNTFDSEAATPVHVKPGVEIAGIRFTVKPARLANLKGRLAGAPQQRLFVQRPATGAGPTFSPIRVTLVRTADSSLQDFAVATNVDESGEFDLKGVPPGSYILSSRMGEANQPLEGRTRVDVANADVSNIVVELRPGIEVRGRISFRSGLPVGFDFSQLGVSLIRLDSSPTLERNSAIGSFMALPLGESQTRFKPVNNDGGFVIDNVPPGEFRIRVERIPQGAYLESARLGQIDALTAAVSFHTQGGLLEITVGASPGHVLGSVSDEKGPVAGAQAILVPDSPYRGRSDIYFTSVADQNGQFVFGNVPPGRYKAFAWEDQPNGAYRNSVYIQKYEQFGTPIILEPNGRVTAPVRLIRSTN